MTAETSNARWEVVAERQAWYEQQIALAEGQWAAAFLDRWECGDDVPSKEHYVALWLAERAAPPPAAAEPKTLPVPTRVYLTDKAAVIVGDPQRGWDEEGPDAHNCDAMGCATIGPHVLARVPFTDERALSQRPAPSAPARPKVVLVRAGDGTYYAFEKGQSEQPAAEEQLTYKGVPIGPMQTFADMERQASAPVGAAEDIVMDAIERRESSAPVEVKTLSEFMAEQEALHPGIHDKVQAATDELRASLAQQSAAVDEGYPTPRNRAEAVALARLALAHLGVIDAHIDAAIARCETNSAAQHQEPATCSHVFRRDEDNGGNCCQLCDEVKS